MWIYKRILWFKKKKKKSRHNFWHFCASICVILFEIVCEHLWLIFRIFVFKIMCFHSVKTILKFILKFQVDICFKKFNYIRERNEPWIITLIYQRFVCQTQITIITALHLFLTTDHFETTLQTNFILKYEMRG